MSDEPRRADQRVTGPFDGRWAGPFSRELRIHDLSVSGCLIESFHEEPAGRRFTLELDLPYEGWISVEAETVYARSDFGFAVKFVEVSSEIRQQLERVVHRLAATGRTTHQSRPRV